MGIIDKINRLWMPAELKDCSILDRLSIGYTVAGIVFIIPWVIVEPFGVATMVLSLWYATRFPKTMQKVFGIKPNDNEFD